MNLGTIFKAALEASWQASLVILLILLLRPLLGWRVPARWRSLLWMLVLLRLLVPAFLLPPSPASLQNIAAVDHPFEQAGFAVGEANPRPASAPAQGLHSQGTDPEDYPASAGAGVEKFASSRLAWWRIAMAVWLSGAVLAAAWIFTATLYLHRRVQREATSAEGWIEEIWLRCCAQLAVRRPPRLRATACIESPALLGLLRPSLLIPKSADFSAADWEHVFLHELAHFRRRDHWLHALQLLALCAHWFNPLVWLGFRCLRADRELAADEWALRRLDEDRSVAYGDTLLKVLTAHSRAVLTPGLVGIMEDGAQMKQRLRHIVAFTPRRVVGSVVGLVTVLALAAVVLGRQAADLAAYEGLTPAESLIVAARGGDREVVEQLLHEGADVNAVVKMRGERTALTEAIAAHDLALVRQLVAKGADVNLAPGKGSPPLVVALKKGWPEVADFLREKGATCDAELLAAAKGELDSAGIEKLVSAKEPDREKLKQLCEIAAANGHADLFASIYDAIHGVRGLENWELDHGPSVGIVANGHRAVFEKLLERESGNLRTGVVRYAAAAAQTPGMREWLQSKDFKVPEYNDGERLIDAAEREDLPSIRRLLDAGVDIHFRGEADWTPLTKAATWGCPRAVKLLLERGADPNGKRYNNYSTLELSKTPEIAELLFKAGAKVTPKDIDYCVTFGSVELVQWFLDHGVDVSAVQENGSSLLAKVGKPEIAKVLIEHGIDVRARTTGGDTALHEIARYGRNAAPTLRVLLEHGADPNARDERGGTPLMAARDGASVDVLVEFGADLTATTEDGSTVLNSHSHMANASRLETLLRHGLKLDEKTGPYLLAHAANAGQIDTVKFLLDHGVDANARSPINPQTESTWTPLSTIIWDGHYAIAKLLVEHGADGSGVMGTAIAAGRPQLVRLFWEHGVRNISELCYAVTQSAPPGELEPLLAKAGAADPPGEAVTPLGAAAVLGNMQAVKFLIERGANPNAGKPSALAIAADRGQDEVVAYLLEHGGKATASLVASVANNSNPYPAEPPIGRFNKIMKLMLDHGALENCTEEEAANVLTAAIITRNPGGNPVVLKMLLDRGLSVHAHTSGGIYFGDSKPAEGTKQTVLDVVRAAKTSGCWQPRPDVAALIEQAAETTRK